MSRKYSPLRGIRRLSVTRYSLSKIPAQLKKKFRHFKCLVSIRRRFLFVEMWQNIFPLHVCYETRSIGLSIQYRALYSANYYMHSIIEIQKRIKQLTFEKLNKHEESSYSFETRLHCCCCRHIYKPFSGNPHFFADYRA